MDAIDAIMSRRSIRSYTEETVSKGDSETLLEAAMAAPSAGNEQPWHFVVVQDREVLEAIPRYHQYADMLREAPLAVVICGDLDEEKHEGFWVQDCSAAVQNLLVAAHALGLGAVWLGVHPEPRRVEGTRELLGLPQQVVPLAIVSVGHPAEEKPPAERYCSERVHWDRW